MLYRRLRMQLRSLKKIQLRSQFVFVTVDTTVFNQIFRLFPLIFFVNAMITLVSLQTMDTRFRVLGDQLICRSLFENLSLETVLVGLPIDFPSFCFPFSCGFEGQVQLPVLYIFFLLFNNIDFTG